MLKKINTALEEFTTTIPLFQKDRTLTFELTGTIKNIKNTEAEQEIQYKSSFKLSPELTIVLLGRITESDQRFLKEKNRTFLRDKHDGYGIFTRIDLSLFSVIGDDTSFVLHLTYKNDRVDPEDTENPAKDFRNWPEEMVLNLVSQKLFQRAAEESIRIKKNSLFVEILETMKIEEFLENPDSGKCNTIFKSLLSAFEKMVTNPFGGSSLWQSQKMWVDVLENCIQTDIPINEVAAFCLATGRFPKKKELGLEKEKLVIEGPER
jgi:hypothetical protein